ncbi:hypothetical protein [Natronomonas sp.]|uniref:hypothetical protein n=1 Tax=Natronomonas sp. TaxID=2184060 RepID=UPI002FC3D124
MSDDWFTTEGETGTLAIEYRDDGWFVASPGTVGETRCMFDDSLEPGDETDRQRIQVIVSSFREGLDGGVNFLSLAAPNDGASEDANGRTNETKAENNGTVGGTNGTKSSSNEQWKLKDFNGSGEYVDVEATIDAVFYVRDDESGIPDMKGELLDSSVVDPVVFIVNDGVSHPYLGEGNRFRFETVKDHYYDKNAEIQVVINEHTEFVELD